MLTDLPLQVAEGTVVEFDVERETDTDKLKAVNVTAAGGGLLEPPLRPRRPKSEAATTSSRKSRGRNKAVVDKAPPEPLFHEVLSHDARAKVQERGIDLNVKNTVDVAVGDARIKLGQGGYAGLAHANGTVAEGTYDCDENGVVEFKWDKCLVCTDGEWKLSEPSGLLTSICLTDDSVGPVHIDETPEKLWGAGKPDPKETFEMHGFLMRRVVLTRPPRGEPRKSDD